MDAIARLSRELLLAAGLRLIWRNEASEFTERWRHVSPAVDPADDLGNHVRCLLAGARRGILNVDDRDNFLMNRHYGLGWAQIKWMLSTDHAGLAFKIAVGNTPSFFHLADTPMGMKMVGGAFAAG